jgi:TonB family protein
MNNDSPSKPPRPLAAGEFTWPPTREELDSIEVIQLGDASPAKPIAVVPAKAIAAPAIARRGRLPRPFRLPRREDVVFAGVICTSVLAIATAASMQFSDLWRPAAEPVWVSEPTITPLIAQALPAMSPIATAPLAALSMGPSAPEAEARNLASTRPPQIAPRAAERRRSSTPRSSVPSAAFAASARSGRPATYARRSGIHARAAAIPRDGDRARPRLISPEDSRRGKLVLLVEVRKNGKVGDVDVLSSDLDRKNRSHRDLQRAAVSTVKRWRYEPAMRDGAPTDTQVRVVVNIDLGSSRVGFTEADARRREAATNRVAESVRAAR